MSVPSNSGRQRHGNPDVTALVYDSTTSIWRWADIPILNLLEDGNTSTCIIFAGIAHFINDPVLRKQLCSHFPNIPRIFWSNTCLQHNGFFGSQTSTSQGQTDSASSDTPSPLKIETWSRLIVKTILTSSMHTTGNKQYSWFEMSFISTFSESRNLLMCFDTPHNLAKDMFRELCEESNRDVAIGPYGLHQLLLEQLMILYDRSVWDISRIMRSIEKNKASNSPRGNTDLTYFIGLYKDSRHVVHSTEATQEASKVYECIAQHCDELKSRPSMFSRLLSKRAEMLRFQHTMMRGFVARAASNDRRMGNEQDLTSNLMSQLDSETNLEMAMATKEDSASMKAIAVATVVFLPATFVSALLGMNFFNYSPDSHGGHITYSHDLWMYFVISIALSLILFALYWTWQHYKQRAIASSRWEHQNARERAYTVLEEG